MKKGVLKLLSMILVFVILSMLVTIGTYAAADNNVQIAVEFDSDEYIVGDEARALVYLKGIYDEGMAGDLIQAYQAYISYDSNKLEFSKGQIYMSSGDEENAVQTVNPVTGEAVVATYMYSENGISIKDDYYRMGDDYCIDVLELFFTVKAPVGSELELGFDNTYSIEAITKDVEKVYNITESTSDTATVVPGEATIKSNLTEYDGSNGLAWSRLRVDVTRENGAVLIAKLYNKETNQLVAPVQTKNLVKGINILKTDNTEKFEFDLFVDDISYKDLEIQYYVWDSLTGMKSVSKSFVDEVYSGEYEG